MPAICREAAVKPVHTVRLMQPNRMILPPLRAGSSASWTPTAFGQKQMRKLACARTKHLTHTAIRLCPEGVGAWLAGDLPRSGSKTGAHGAPNATESYDFATASRWIISNPVACGDQPKAPCRSLPSPAVPDANAQQCPPTWLSSYTGRAPGRAPVDAQRGWRGFLPAVKFSGR